MSDRQFDHVHNMDSFVPDFVSVCVRYTAPSRLRKVATAAFIAAALACTPRDRDGAPAGATGADTTASASAPATSDSSTAVAKSRGADTALSSGVGGLRGSIDSALAATQRRVRPRARARPRALPPLADSI